MVVLEVKIELESKVIQQTKMIIYPDSVNYFEADNLLFDLDLKATCSDVTKYASKCPVSSSVFYLIFCAEGLCTISHTAYSHVVFFSRLGKTAKKISTCRFMHVYA